MKIKSIVATVLIVVGIVVFAYSGITFTTPGQTVEFLGIRVETRDKHFIPPVFGALSLTVGIILLIIKRRSS